MSLIDKVLKTIESNRTKKFNCIPFDIFPRFSKFIPGIKKGLYYAITGVPSSAKTQFTDFAFLYHSYDFAKLSGTEVEVVYFSFELSKEIKIINGISKKLFTDHGIKLGSNYLQSINATLSNDALERVKSVRNYFEDLESYVTFYDEPLTPTQVYNIMYSKIAENGDIKTTANGIEYTPYNPDKYLIFIFDHIGLIQPEHGNSLHQSLGKFSANNVYLKNKFGVTIVNVHQQALEGAIKQFTSKGDAVVAKLEPQMALLGDNRTLSRDYDIILGLFSPAKYEVDFYRGYKTKKFGDQCRFLSILKNREGVPDHCLGLYFDGSVNYFEELPKADAFTVNRNGVNSENTTLYEKYDQGLVGQLDPIKQKQFNFE
jgi:hypothetical protein